MALTRVSFGHGPILERYSTHRCGATGMLDRELGILSEARLDDLREQKDVTHDAEQIWHQARANPLIFGLKRAASARANIALAAARPLWNAAGRRSNPG